MKNRLLEMTGLLISGGLTILYVALAFGQHRYDFLIKALFALLWFVFTLLRPKPKNLDTSWPALLTANGHTALLTLYFAYGQVLFPLLGWSLVVVGSLFCLCSWASIGRAFGILPALRRLKTHGAYRVVRHPIYLSYLVIAAGSLLLSYQTANLVWYFAFISTTILRIEMEERLLATSTEDYRSYRAQVKYKLVPGIY